MPALFAKPLGGIPGSMPFALPRPAAPNVNDYGFPLLFNFIRGPTMLAEILGSMAHFVQFVVKTTTSPDEGGKFNGYR